LGDTICIYAKLLKTGTTSMTYHIKTFVTRRDTSIRELVTQANFTYVKVDNHGKSTPIIKGH